jgi:anthranilate synthase component 1
MNSSFQIPTYDLKPIEIFKALESINPIFLLESVEGEGENARYSFIGLKASKTLEIRDSKAFVNGEIFQIPHGPEEWKSLFRKFLKDAPELYPVLENQPFKGGFIGATGYECAYSFDHLSFEQSQTNLAKASYVAPSCMLVFDHYEKIMTFLSDGSSESLKVMDTVNEALKKSPRSDQIAQTKLTDELASIEKEEFLTIVDQAKKSIFEGDIFQIVLSISFSSSGNLKPIDCYELLRKINPSPYHYLFLNNELSIIGSSPEALVRLEDKKASLRPIAGTRPRGITKDEDLKLEEILINDPKEKAEHIMLIDLARNDLGRVAKNGTIEVSPFMQIERYSHVMHIVSGVVGEIEEDQDAFDLFLAAFPAGTLVGAPKIKAMEIISQLEPQPRGFYGGTIGYFSKCGNMDQAITIRTIVIEGDQISYQAGAGIVADSIPKGEHKEIIAKSNILRNAIKVLQGENA